MSQIVGLLPLVLIFGLFYLLLIRPQQRKAAEQRNMQASLEIGDEIVTAGGFIGQIRRFDGQITTIELSPGVLARIRRGAIVGHYVDPDADATDLSEGDVHDELATDSRDGMLDLDGDDRSRRDRDSL